MAVNKRMELDRFGEPLVLRKAPIPDPPPNGAVVKLFYSGICYGDLEATEKGTGSPLAKVLGHEMSGAVHSLGADVNKVTELRVDDLVVVYPWPGCGVCTFCLAGRTTICPTRRQYAFGRHYVDGGFQNYVSVNQVTWLHRAPEGLPLDLGAIISCSGITAYNALCRVKDTVLTSIQTSGSANMLIIGAGGLGLWGIEMAKLILPKEATIAVTDISDTKLPAAMATGADKTFLWDPHGDTDEKAVVVKEALGGIHVILDFVGHSSTSTAFFRCLEPDGQMVMVGLMGSSLQVDTQQLILKANSLTGSVVGTQGQMVELMDMAATKKIKGPPITHVALEDTFMVLTELKRGDRVGRAVINHNL